MEWKPQIVAQAVRQDEAEAKLLALHRDRRRLELRAARLLACIDGTHHYAYRGCSSIAQYGEQRGFSGREDGPWLQWAGRSSFGRHWKKRSSPEGSPWTRQRR